MSNELQASIIAKINEEHGAFMSLGESASERLLQQINKAREIGMHLQELKKSVRHGEFGRLFKSDSGKANQNPAFDFSAEHGREFMRFAVKYPNPILVLADGIRHVKDALTISGELPPQTRTLGHARGTVGVFSAMWQSLGDFWSVMNKQKEIMPLSEWPDEQILKSVSNLRPGNSFLAELEAEKARRGL